jgi:hypothetical protein
VLGTVCFATLSLSLTRALTRSLATATRRRCFIATKITHNTSYIVSILRDSKLLKLHLTLSRTPRQTPARAMKHGERQKDCVNFERGNCPYGDICKFSHGSAPSPKKTKLCYGFTKGRCNRGSSCQYSHDIPASGSHSSRAATPATHADTGRGAPNGPTAYDQFVQWRYDIKRTRQDINRAQPLGRRFPDFIQQALILVDAPETMQEVITSLPDEGGLERLGELLNADFSVLSDKALQSVFKNQLLPLFQIVAHEAVLSSAVLESRHATLLNYLYGINGKRSVTVFCAAISALTYDEQISADFEPCLIALSAVLEVNGSAQINDDLRTAAELMIALVKEHDLSGNSLKYHRKMCLRLGLGENIRHAEDKKKQSSTRPKPTFELAIDQPGELSEHGPRHDNDCEDIEDIQILPTIGEILGERAEYLPRSDPSTWHLPGIAGLLDRQFRLIREDTVGQLRDAAKVELNRIQHGSGQGMGARHAGARTYSYRNLRLVDAEFDEHKGLLCALQFDQPRELDGKSAAKRKDWWFESNRLAPEALIMLLGSDQVAIFLTVVATAPPPGAKVKASKAADSIEQRYPRSESMVLHT